MFLVPKSEMDIGYAIIECTNSIEKDVLLLKIFPKLHLPILFNSQVEPRHFAGQEVSLILGIGPLLKAIGHSIV